MLISIGVVLFYLPTLTTSVPVWNDDTMIVEYGRVALSTDPGPSTNERLGEARPAYSIALLGTTLQEIAYRVTAPSNLGPHLSALLGQLIAFGRAARDQQTRLWTCRQNRR